MSAPLWRHYACPVWSHNLYIIVKWESNDKGFSNYGKHIGLEMEYHRAIVRPLPLTLRLKWFHGRSNCLQCLI